jgi:hypothetical protein
MSDLTIKHRAAAVRKSWSYGEHLQRAVAAQNRCQRLLAQLGLTQPPPKFAYATQSARRGSGRRIG